MWYNFTIRYLKNYLFTNDTIAFDAKLMLLEDSDPDPLLYITMKEECL